MNANNIFNDENTWTEMTDAEIHFFGPGQPSIILHQIENWKRNVIYGGDNSDDVIVEYTIRGVENLMDESSYRTGYKKGYKEAIVEIGDKMK